VKKKKKKSIKTVKMYLDFVNRDKLILVFLLEGYDRSLDFFFFSLVQEKVAWQGFFFLKKKKKPLLAEGEFEAGAGGWLGERLTG
jgi:hypothetical protein